MEQKVQKKQCMIAIVLDLLIIVFGILGTYIEIYENGLGMLGYYTVDSNILMVVCCFLDIIYQARELQGQQNFIWIKDIKYTGVCCMTITFCIVFFVLAPMGGLEGYRRIFFEGALKYQHFLCPILTIASFLFIDRFQTTLKRSMVYVALIPTIIYAVITTSLNIAKVMYGPYPFLYVYEQSVGMSVFWCILIISIEYAIVWLLWKTNQILKEK